MPCQMFNLVVFLLVLSFLVFIHELGHFLFAKRAGILVREFAIGFGPKLLYKRKGETLYSIRAFPLGGYVKMAGEDGDTLNLKPGNLIYATKNKYDKIDNIYLYEVPYSKELIVGKLVESDTQRDLHISIDDGEGKIEKYALEREAFVHFDPRNREQIAPLDRQFGSKSTGQKAMAIFAGPLFNVLLTVILFIVFTGIKGVPDYVVIKKVMPNKPAIMAGLKSGDKILSINNDKVTTLDELSAAIAKGGSNKPLILSIERDGEKQLKRVIPVHDNSKLIIGAEHEQGYKSVPFLKTFSIGIEKTWNLTKGMVAALGGLLTGQHSLKELSGPVQIGVVVGNAAQHGGIIPLLHLTAFLSLNLGIINLLPFPALDGSRLVFLGIEAIRRRPTNPNVEGIIHMVGFALLIILMLIVTFQDIKKVFL